jgi:putative transposase
MFLAIGIAGIGRRRFRKTTDPGHDLPIAENTLAPRFDVHNIGDKNRLRAGDTSYLPTPEGRLYLAVVLDLSSRRVIGWSMRTTIERSLVIDATSAAIKSRRFTAGFLFTPIAPANMQANTSASCSRSMG